VLVRLQVEAGKLAKKPTCFDKIHPRMGSDQDKTVPAEDIERILRAVNAPVQFSQCQPPLDETRVRYAFMSAPLMRKRLTLGDVLIFFRWNRDQLWKQIWEEEPI